MTDKLFQDYAGAVNVKDYGAVGNGVTDDAAAIQLAVSAAFGNPPHGGVLDMSGSFLNKSLDFPPGDYVTSTPINLTAIHGGRIRGAGRHATRIRNASGAVFNCDGVQYTRFEDMNLKSASTGSGIVFDLTSATSSTYSISNQSNTCINMFFDSGAYGVKIAPGVSPPAGGPQGSENSFINCFWISQTVAGLATLSSNALQNQVYGGNFQSCAIGIWAASGSVCVVSGVGFQNFTGVDIQTDSNQGPDSMTIQGCRSETENFIFNNGGQYLSVLNCGVSPGTEADGYFLKQPSGYATVQGCKSRKAKIYIAFWGNVDVSCCDFGRTDWYELAAGATWGGQGLGDATDGQAGCCLTARQIKAGGGMPTNGQPALQEVHVRIDAAGIVRRFGYGLTTVASGNGTVASPGSTAQISIASPGVITNNSGQVHGLHVNCPVVFGTSGSLPTGISGNTTYFVKTIPSTSTFTIAATAGGTAINTSGSQSGTHKLYIGRHWEVGDRITNSAPSVGNPGGWVCTTAGYNTTGGGAVFKAEANLV